MLSDDDRDRLELGLAADDAAVAAAAAVPVAEAPLPDRDLKWNTMRSACFLREVMRARCRRPRCSVTTPRGPPPAAVALLSPS